MTTTDQPQEGVRERKQRETRRRIAETALELFLQHGFENTTLDAIAEASGISRRTFFSYFKSKEDVVLAWQDSAWAAIWADLLEASPDEAPLEAVQRVLVQHAGLYEADRMRAIDEVMRASDALIARKQTVYVQQEAALYAALCQVWRQPQRRPALRILAMACMGALRVAIQDYGEADDGSTAASHVEEAFALLKILAQS
jgi:AcrR family transcriptional regulator